jgi:paraquat-inducible protein B
MSRRASPRLIGLFVLGAAALLIGALVVFGGGRLLAAKDLFVMFFEDDVAGLQVGAPVTFRGVRVGTVKDIRIRYDTDNHDFTIPVIVELERSKTIVEGKGGWEGIDQLVERGLRAQLKLQSFVTGLVAVDLDIDPRTPPRLVGSFTNYPEIPTKRSSISEIRATVSDLITEVRKLPVDKLLEQFTIVSQNTATLLGHVDALVVDINSHVNASFAEVPALVGETRTLIADLDSAAREIATVTREVGNDMPQISQGTLDAVGRLNKTLDQAQASLASVQDALGERSPVQFQMNQALTEITAAASAVRVLAEYLQQNPNALLSGKGAPAQ